MKRLQFKLYFKASFFFFRYVADQGNVRVRGVSSSLHGAGSDDRGVGGGSGNEAGVFEVPDPDANEAYVFNKFGQHMITHELLVNGPPAPPSVLLTSQTTNSVTLKLKQKNDKTPIHGFRLHYKPEFGDWDYAQIPYGADEFTLDELLCGQRYNLYVTAYNE